jgi:hypothetical protein
MGLGIALVGEGRAARGVSLLERALATTQARGLPDGGVRLALARALAERLDDLPTAIAHASAVAADAAEAATARGLEGRWRARLGDLAGASLAFARLRDRAASRAPARVNERIDDETREATALLLEAAAMERERRDDPLAAQRHLAVALRLAPHDAEARRTYREVGAQIAGAPLEEERAIPAGGVGASPVASPASAGEAHVIPEANPTRPVLDAFSDAFADDATRAARVEDLTQRLRGDPTNEAAADELAALLEALGRGHELVALLIGRVEDAPANRRDAVRARARATFERMMARGDADEGLYRDALESVS